MFKMLDKIELYLKENNIDLTEMKLEGNIIDDYFRTAVTNIIRRGAHRNNDSKIYFDDADYYLKRDTAGNLYIEAISHDKKYRVLICDYLEKGLNISTDNYTFLYAQKAVMQDAAMYKILKNVRKRIRKEIELYDGFKSLTPLIKRKIEFNRMGVIIKHMYENNRGQLLTLYDQSQYCYNNQNTVDNIINAISEKYSRDGIFFKKAVCENLSSDSDKKTSSISRTYNERLNPELPFDKRISVLEKYEPIFSNYCYSMDRNKIDYMSYLYHLGEGYYALILEPYCPTAYTKLFLFNDFIDSMDEEEFTCRTREYLQLSDDSMFRDKRAYRFGHTTMKNFESMMACIFDGEKKNIDKRINTKRHKKSK